MEPAYQEAYRDLFEHHWWWKARRRIVLAELERIHPTRQWGKILDIGCGDGFLFPELSKMGEVVGVESSAEMVTRRGRQFGTIYIQPFDRAFDPGMQFDLILMLDVLEHMADDLSALQHVAELLAPDGVTLITVPAFKILWTAHDELNHHYRRYTKRSLRDLAEQAGLRIFSSRYLFQWLFPAKIVIRMKNSTLGHRAAIPRIPPSWLNQLLTAISFAEYRGLKAVRPPVGSSLLVLASRR